MVRKQPKTLLDLVRVHIQDADQDDPVVQELVEVITDSPATIRGVANLIIALVKQGNGFSQYWSTGGHDCVGEDDIATSVREIAEAVGAEYNTNLIEQLKYYRRRFRLESERCSEYFNENYRLRSRVSAVERYRNKLERAVLQFSGEPTVSRALYIAEEARQA